MNFQFQYIRESYLDRVDVANYLVKLILLEEAPLGPAWSRVFYFIQELGKANTENILARVIVEPTPNKWAVSIVFMLKKNRTFHFYADYENLSAVKE